MKARKVISLLLALVFVFSLMAGCGNSSSTPSNTSDSTPSDDFTADKELQNGQNMVAAGSDGICFQSGKVVAAVR